MSIAQFNLGRVAGTMAAWMFLPVCIGLFFAYESGAYYGPHFVVKASVLSISVLIASLVMMLLTWYWRKHCGEGLWDTLWCVLASLPFFAMIEFMDPLGMSSSVVGW
jgi:hypothetical protein